MTTKDEKKHFRKLAEFGCALCYKLGYEGTPAEIHHIRRGGIRSKSPVIPLCTEHHRGNSSIHGMGRKLFELTFKTTEEELLEMVSTKFPPPNL